MISIIGNPERQEIRTLRGSLRQTGYPAVIVPRDDRETLLFSLAVIVTEDGAPPSFVDPERVVYADVSALASREPGVAVSETERIGERVGEVLEIKSGVRFGNFSSKLYVERNGVSVFLGETLPLTERERLVVRLLYLYPGRYLTARTVARACFPDGVGDGAVRTAVYEINRRAKTLTGFPLIESKPISGYSFSG